MPSYRCLPVNGGMSAGRNDFWSLRSSYLLNTIHDTQRDIRPLTRDVQTTIDPDQVASL